MVSSLSERPQFALASLKFLGLNLNREKERRYLRPATVRMRSRESTTSLLLILWNCLKNNSAFWGTKITASSRFSIRWMYFHWKFCCSWDALSFCSFRASLISRNVSGGAATFLTPPASPLPSLFCEAELPGKLIGKIVPELEGKVVL